MPVMRQRQAQFRSPLRVNAFRPPGVDVDDRLDTRNAGSYRSQTYTTGQMPLAQLQTRTDRSRMHLLKLPELELTAARRRAEARQTRGGGSSTPGEIVAPAGFHNRNRRKQEDR